MTACTRAELAEFQRLREAGRVSFFRAAACRECGTEIPPDKAYCSMECKEKSMAWEALEALVDKQVSIETTDGCRRNGTLTGINWAAVTVSGEEIRYPVGLRLDAEPGDELPWIRLRWVRERDHDIS